MKQSIISILILVSLNSLSFGQNHNDTLYYNLNWENTTKSDYSYFRVITLDDNGKYLCKDYWKSGELQMTGKYTDPDFKIRDGKFVWYNKNGSIKQIVSYKDNKITGKVQLFDSNGNIRFEYVSDLEDLDNRIEFKNAIYNFRIYASRHLNYPRKIRKEGIQGKALVYFYIDSLGQPYGLKIQESLNEVLDQEAIRVIKSYKKWPVPKYMGKSTFVFFSIPVIFVMD